MVVTTVCLPLREVNMFNNPESCICCERILYKFDFLKLSEVYFSSIALQNLLENFFSTF